MQEYVTRDELAAVLEGIDQRLARMEENQETMRATLARLERNQNTMIGTFNEHSDAYRDHEVRL